MKSADLRKMLKKNGAELLRHGGQHDIWTLKNKMAPVPRHREIAEGTVRNILRQLGIKP